MVMVKGNLMMVMVMVKVMVVIDMAARIGYNPNLGNKVSGNVADQTGNDSTSGYGWEENKASVQLWRKDFAQTK